MNLFLTPLYTILVIFIIMLIIAITVRPGSVYKDKPEEQNPMEGKKVVFVEDDSKPENADGVRGHLDIIALADHTEGFYEKYFKRMLDIVLSFCGILILFPLYLAIALWIVIDDPGPVIFTQKRIGKNKQYFKLHKFRSMKISTPHDIPTHMLASSGQYITKAGHFMRRHSLDELPQLWDIFIGNMSIVGPRPALWNQDLLTAERDKWGANDIKPGLTGWAQINGRDELSIPEKAEMDGIYTKKLGIVMDIKCFIASIAVLKGDDNILESASSYRDNRKKEQEWKN